MCRRRAASQSSTRPGHPRTTKFFVRRRGKTLQSVTRTSVPSSDRARTIARPEHAT
ncbi:hypothetical protein F2Q69_00007634 [Brassica cretica]|uniref:Uncharacterized protein n=1 Tax=Brassica cretica TaxID=69181 RepID=A0A8S9NVH6_BRACR|nr:hypothetical protein F2Q69_00007634 [Brassica cretica]